MKTVRAVYCDGPRASWQGADAATSDARRALRRIVVALVVALVLVLVALTAADPPTDDAERRGAAVQRSLSIVDRA